MIDHLNSFLQIAEHAADQAGAVIRPYFRHPIQTENKSDNSPVTKADRAAEQAIRKILQNETPDFGIIGEEYGNNDTSSAYQWVIDPIDGTRSFITGRPLFGTLIALLHHGIPVLGIIDQPVTKERWIGIQGQGTRFISEFGGKCGTRSCTELRLAEASCTAPEILKDAPTQQWKALCQQVNRMSWGGDCYAYGLLTIGQIDLIFEYGNKIWDWAALVPIIEGAGGYIGDWQGKPLTLQNNNQSVLALGDPSLKMDVIQFLNH